MPINVLAALPSGPGQALPHGTRIAQVIRLHDSHPHETLPHQIAADRQPFRNRDPRDARRGRDEHPHGGHLFQGRPARAAPLQGRRELPRRRGQEAAGGLPGHRRHPARRQAGQGRCHPPRLRLPVREPRLRPGGDRRRHPLDRPLARGDAHARQQGGRPQRRRGSRRAGDAGHAALAGRPGRVQAPRAPDRLPDHAQGQLGRRRSRDARARVRARPGALACRGPARGPGRLRQ